MADAITIRPMTIADVAACAQWIAETPLWQRYHITQQSIGERLRTGLDQGATIYVADRAGEVLGFLWLVTRGAFARSDYVQLIGVRPSERGRGIGHILMEFAEAKSLVEGRALFLLVSDFNTDAQRFYERLGYRPVGQLVDYVVQGVTELIYCKMGTR